MFHRIEKQLKKRFAIGTQVSEHVIIQDFVRQNYTENVVRKVNTRSLIVYASSTIIMTKHRTYY